MWVQAHGFKLSDMHTNLFIQVTLLISEVISYGLQTVGTIYTSETWYHHNPTVIRGRQNETVSQVPPASSYTHKGIANRQSTNHNCDYKRRTVCLCVIAHIHISEECRWVWGTPYPHFTNDHTHHTCASRVMHVMSYWQLTCLLGNLPLMAIINFNISLLFRPGNITWPVNSS
jgi:hypothetical protein